MTAEVIVRHMCANPTNKKVYFRVAKMVFTDQTVIVTPNIKDNSVITSSQQISRSKSLLNILRSFPICIFYGSYPILKRSMTSHVRFNCLSLNK